jgi:hypothetical protein
MFNGRKKRKGSEKQSKAFGKFWGLLVSIRLVTIHETETRKAQG